MYNVLCRNNDKFPSSSIVNCCTDVTFSVKFQFSFSIVQLNRCSCF
uniref:Uncharacterized protein n=1 Tax=Malurus cyaneus samueli TaxID=2593467 RepID=A0A8C5UJF3_9PASS